jgi:hypothetical protein
MNTKNLLTRHSREAERHPGFVRVAEYLSLLDSRLRGNDEVLR